MQTTPSAASIRSTPSGLALASWSSGRHQARWRKRRASPGTTSQESVCAIGWVFLARRFMILSGWRFSPWTFIFRDMAGRAYLPPRKGFAEQWHPALLALMPNVRLTVLVGAYAVRRYLHLKNSDSLTTVVRDYDAYIGRGFFPLVHPSPRNQLWMSRNPWFEAETLPALKARVNAALEQR